MNLRLFCLNLLLIFSLLLTNSCILDENDSPVNFSGTITDSSGKGIANAKVKIDYESENKIVEATSSGNYEFEVPHGGTIQITFYKEGYTPQSQNFIFKDNGHVFHDQSLNSLQEDAFFDIDKTALQIKNKKGSFNVQISSNVNYEIKYSESWLKYQKSGSIISFDYEGNNTLGERTVIIEFVAEYGLHKELTVVQEKGPILELTDYIGKDEKSNFLTTDAFISFNREVKLKSITSTYSGIDLTSSISDDKNTLYFPHIKLPTFESVSFSYEVEDTNGELFKGVFSLSLCEKSKAFANLHRLSMVFRTDNKSVWIKEIGSIKQYSTEDLSLMNTIDWPNNDSDQNKFFYNRYNDCIYFVNYSFDKGCNVTIHNAKTGAFIKQLDFSSIFGKKQIFINKIGFGYNGLGIITIEDKLYYIDSRNNHTLTPIPDNPNFYVRASDIVPCNNGKTLLLIDIDGNRNIFCVDIDSKDIIAYNDIQRPDYEINYTYPGIVLSTYLNEHYTYLNVVSGTKITQKTEPNYTGKRIFLGNQTELPILLTSFHSLIDMNNSSEKLFERISEIYPMASSDNGKIVILGYKGKLFLFNSDLFTKYSNKIK